MRGLLAGLAVVAVLGAAACGSGHGGDAAAAGRGEDTTLTVFAAASLESVFTELGSSFESAHDGVSVRFGFGGSSDLVAQLRQGAPADVFASADTANMDKAVADELVDGEPVDFATNTLQIATPPDNPAGVDSLRDLAGRDVRVVVCAPEVPCGAAAAQVEDNAGVRIEPVSEEQSVTDVLGKVVAGEADAGLVYVTDVAAAGERVHGVPFPEAADVVNVYPIVTLADSEHRDLARRFVDHVTGEAGRDALRSAGFGVP
jgi:molybdate transport system substrate-binding protein